MGEGDGGGGAEGERSWWILMLSFQSMGTIPRR